MSQNILPLGLLVFLLVTPCFMAPFWSDEDLATSGKDDEDIDTILKTTNMEEYPLFDLTQPVEEPKTKLIITPNRIIFRTYFSFGPFENNNSDEDVKSLIDSDENQGNERDIISSWEPLYPDYNKNDNDKNEESVVQQINENYLRNLINTLTVMAKLNEIMANINSEEETTTTNDDDDDGIKVIFDNGNVKSIEDDVDIKTDQNGETNVIAKSASNPNVDIKLTFDGFTDDENLPETIGERVDSSMENDDNDDDDDKAIPPNLFVIPDNEILKKMENSDENNQLDFITTTKRTTEWDDSDENDDDLKEYLDILDKPENNIKFVPVLKTNLDDINYEPKYKYLTQ